MKFWPEVHWSEGQFLRPHHFQAALRQVETLRSAMLEAAQPFGWGFLSLDLTQEAIENNLIEVHACELLLRDGSWVKIPENCSLDPRDFKKLFDQAAGPLDAYLGVPELQAVRSNVQSPGEQLDGRSPRYAIDLSERYDENIRRRSRFGACAARSSSATRTVPASSVSASGGSSARPPAPNWSRTSFRHCCG